MGQSHWSTEVVLVGWDPVNGQTDRPLVWTSVVVLSYSSAAKQALSSVQGTLYSLYNRVMLLVEFLNFVCSSSTPALNSFIGYVKC